MSDQLLPALISRFGPDSWYPHPDGGYEAPCPGCQRPPADVTHLIVTSDGSFRCVKGCTADRVFTGLGLDTGGVPRGTGSTDTGSVTGSNTAALLTAPLPVTL